MLAFSYCGLQIHINLFFSHIITDIGLWSITIQMKSCSSELLSSCLLSENVN
jgi:hypothetical protein